MTTVAQVVAVTGASGGIGRATAVAFAARGAKVALLARGEKGLAGAAAEIESRGGHALVVPVDVADADAVERIESELGPIDVWVNVVFTAVFARFWHVEPAEYRRATEVSYLGYVYCTSSVLKRMMVRDQGTIVHVGSALAYRSIPLQSAYCGAKRAIQGFHESLRVELMHERSNVHVTMVQMPAVNAPQFSWVLSRMPDHAQPVPPIEPADGPDGKDFGIHGVFDDRSTESAPQLWFSHHHKALIAAGATAVAGVGALVMRQVRSGAAPFTAPCDRSGLLACCGVRCWFPAAQSFSPGCRAEVRRRVNRRRSRSSQPATSVRVCCRCWYRTTWAPCTPGSTCCTRAAWSRSPPKNPPGVGLR